MADNPYTGESEIKIGKKTCLLVFDWYAISELHSKFAAELSADGFINVNKIHDPLKLANILAIGLKRHNPEMTADEIIKANPPLAFMKAPLDAALAFSYFGPDIMAEVRKASQAAEKLVKDVSKKKRQKK